MSRILWLGLAFAACANTHPGSGPGPGSGSGSDNGSFTLDRTGFYDDGQRLWSPTSAPTLTGTISEPGALRAFIAGQQVGGDATVDGDRWTLALPDGSIAPADTPVTLRLDAAELVQAFALDDSPPVIASGASIIDERGDAIDFSTGVPIHRHAGPRVALGAGCPDVYKYAYLMDSHAPTFGREVSANPLAFAVQLDAAALADPSTAMFRVRTAAGTVLADWAPLPALDANGAATIALYRDSIPALGVTSGELHLEVRVADFLGRTSVSDTCWVHHPLAAPLSASPSAQAATGSSDALATWTLAASSPVSRLLQAGTAANVLAEKLVQQTREPLTFDVTFTPPSMSYAKTAVADFLPPTTSGASLYCGTTCNGGSSSSCVPDPVTDPACKTGAPFDPPDQQTSGSITTGTWHVFVLAGNGVSTECTAVGPLEQRCSIAPRDLGEGPQPYTVIAALDGVIELRPTFIGPFGEFTLAGVSYTGTAPTTVTRCGSMELSLPDVDGSVVHTCRLLATYSEFVALQHVQLTATGGGFHITSAPTASGTQLDLPYLDHGFAANAIFFWDSGIDDLPGTAH